MRNLKNELLDAILIITSKESHTSQFVLPKKDDPKNADTLYAYDWRGQCIATLNAEGYYTEQILIRQTALN